MGYSVTCHPEVDGTNRRPDFLAEKDGRSSYLEARSASSSDITVGKSAQVNALYESLDKLDSRTSSSGSTLSGRATLPFARGRCGGAWRSWLAGLDPDEQGPVVEPRDELPGLTHQDAGWTVEFRAFPSRPRPAAGKACARSASSRAAKPTGSRLRSGSDVR